MTTVDKSGPRVREMFGEIASRYDFINHLLSLNIDRYWRWQTVRRVPPAPGAKILDLCTGTGDLALAYHRAAAGRAKIVGADFCHEMLAIGQRKGVQAGADGAVTFIEADAQQIPLANDQFQIVCIAFGLRNVADTEGGLAEMVRVCAPGGRVAVLEFSTPQWQPFKAVYGWYFRYLLPRIGQLVSRSAQGAFPQGERLADSLRKVGLIDVWYRGLTFGVATLYVGTKAVISCKS